MSTLKMTRGDSFSFDVAITDDNGPINITGGLLIFTLKYNFSDGDNQAVAQKKSSTGGITITDALNGKATVKLLPADTRPLPDNWVRLVWDLQLVLGPNIYTVSSGTLGVTPDVTITTT